MKSFYLEEILKIVEGTVVKGSGNPTVDYATYRPGMMRGEAIFFDRYRGSYYYPESFQEYATPVIVTENPEIFEVLTNDAIVVKVKNVDDAYWAFLKHYREIFPIPIMGITGTCGKTTTKEMIKHILKPEYKVRATYKSQNAGYLDIHYLVGINEETDFGVIEMGVLWPGDLTDSCRLFKPQVRVILNIGVYHLTGCKSPEEYLKAKAEMAQGINDNEILILNSDDENIKKIDVSKVKNIIYFGSGDKADYRIKSISYKESGMAYTFVYKDKEYSGFVPGLGEHNVYNAVAAIAAVSAVNIDIDFAVKKLEDFNQVTEHLELRKGFGGSTIIDDTWSSAPPSVVAALEVLKGISNSKKKIALLGFMPLLGEGKYAEDEYRNIGEKAVEAGVDMLIVVGEEAKEIGNRALELGMDKDKIYFSNEGNEVWDIIEPYLNKDSNILLKITHRKMIEPSFEEFKNKLIVD